MDALVKLLVYIAVFAIACIVIFYLLKQFELPDPIMKIIHIMIVVVAGIIAIVVILQAAGVSRFGRAETPMPYHVVVNHDHVNTQRG